MELTFTDFINIMNPSNHSKVIDEIKVNDELKHWINESYLLNQLPFQTHGVFYIYDFSQNKFQSISNSIQLISGYDPKDFLSNGIETFFRIIHQDDFRIFNEKIFPKNIQFLKERPFSDHCKYIFSNNFRVMHKSGEQLQLLNKTLYHTFQDTGLPHFCFGSLIEITDYKRDNLVIHRIDMDVLSDHTAYKPIFLTYYSPEFNDIQLSKQEQRILYCISEGLNSKEIAEKLHLSDSTIINHRKNMQKKTRTKNVAELISFSFRNKLLK